MHVSFTESNINGTRLDRPIIVLHANNSLLNNNICVMVLSGDKQKTEYKHISWEKCLINVGSLWVEAPT